MKIEFDKEELIMIHELIKEKAEEIKDNEAYRGSNKILKSISEKLNDYLK